MNKYKSLAQNIVLFAVNSVATKLIAFVLVPLYTYYLSEGEYGITDMSLTVITLMVPLATLSISDAVLRFVIDDSKNTDRYVTAGLAIVLVSFAIVTVMLPLLDLGIFGGLGDYKLWFLAAYASNAMLTYQSNVARALDQVRIIPFAAGISSLATLIGAFVFIAQLRLGVEGYFIATILGGVCGSLVYEALGKHRDHLLHVGMSDLRVDLKKMMSYAIPLTPNTLFWWVNNSISRFFVTGFLGIASNGLYAAASKIPNLLNAVFQIFQQAWQISAYQEFKKRGPETSSRRSFRHSSSSCSPVPLCSLRSLHSSPRCSCKVASIPRGGTSRFSWSPSSSTRFSLSTELFTPLAWIQKGCSLRR